MPASGRTATDCRGAVGGSREDWLDERDLQDRRPPPDLTHSVFKPTPELCEEYDVADVATLCFTVESCERCGRQLRVGVGPPGEEIELVSPEIAASRVAWLSQAAIAQAVDGRPILCS
jgi:hypothetical protein